MNGSRVPEDVTPIAPEQLFADESIAESFTLASLADFGLKLVLLQFGVTPEVRRNSGVSSRTRVPICKEPAAALLLPRRTSKYPLEGIEGFTSNTGGCATPQFRCRPVQFPAAE